MSFVVDQVRRIDGLLDRVQVLGDPSSGADDGQHLRISQEEAHDPRLQSRIHQLQTLTKSLSPAASSRAPLVPIKRIVSILRQAELSSVVPRIEDTSEHVQYESGAQTAAPSSFERELEWFLISKAIMQAYGQVLNIILSRTIQLSDDIWYWDDILGSYQYAALYSVQTSPLRLYNWGKEVYNGVQAKGVGLEEGWHKFYGLVREVARERNVADIRKRMVSPLSLVTNEVRRKRTSLRTIRHVNANALGVLLGEGLSDGSTHDDTLLNSVDATCATAENRHKWKSAVVKCIALMEAVLQTVSDRDVTADTFDEIVADIKEDDPYSSIDQASSELDTLSLKPLAVSERLQSLLLNTVSQYSHTFNDMAKANGRPSRLIRYWLPLTAAILSSSTLLRIFVNRREAIITWVREFGQTIIDFGVNWVVEPLKKVIGTIRHDEESEVSIMSKRSLEGDRSSLERMVVDFATQHPDGPALNESQIADIRAKVREGDLTPVLKAYEKDMAKPLMGAVRGNLVQALLIQVQKTKVDVEVAMSGIDSILKSQELLFGFIGLTPGVLVTIAAWRWLSSMFSTRKGIRRGTKQGELVRILRNIDRILVNARPTQVGELEYKDHGLLLCEVHLLRQTARAFLPRRVFYDFLEEINELIDHRAGLEKQLKVSERVRWAYSKWFA